MDATTQLIHEKMAMFFKPTRDNFLCEYIEEIKSAGGVLLPLPQKSMGHPIVAVGPEVTDVKSTDWIILSAHNVSVFEAFGRKWFFARPYDIYSVVDMKYLQAQEELAKDKAEQSKIKVLTN